VNNYAGGTKTQRRTTSTAPATPRREQDDEGVGIAKACEMPTCWCPQGPGRDEPWGPPGTDEDTRAWHLTDDHIIPLFEVGPNTAANKRPAHRLCNRMDATVRLGRIPQKDIARIARAYAAAAALVAPFSAAGVEHRRRVLGGSFGLCYPSWPVL
jgi:hypothetical protein